MSYSMEPAALCNVLLDNAAVTGIAPRMLCYYIAPQKEEGRKALAFGQFGQQERMVFTVCTKGEKIICLQAEGSRASSSRGWCVGIPTGGAILPVCHASAAWASVLGGDLPCD